MHRLIFALLVALAASASAQDYTATCLPGRDAADAVSFAIDARGVAHVIRLYRFTGGLEHVEIAPDGGTTSREIANFISQIADDEVIDTDVALEGTRPWACYLNAARDRFEVARLSGDAWVSEVVSEGAGQGRWCSLIIEDGHPVVAFGSDDGALRVAERTGPDAWAVEVIDAPPGRGVGRDVDLAQVEGLGRVIAHRTAFDQLRVTWADDGRWRSVDPLQPAGPTGATPTVVDAGGGSLWIVHGGPASDRDSDVGLFLTRGSPAALDTFTLQLDFIGGSVGAVRRGDHLLVAAREKQRSALFGNADALTLWTDAAGAPVIADLARNGPNDTRHIYRDLALALDPFNQPVLLTSDLTEVAAGSPDGAEVCLYRRTDTDGDGVPDVVEIAAGGAPDSPDSDGDGIDDFAEIISGGSVFAETRVLAAPRQYGAAGCVASDETFDGAPVYRFADAPRVGCQFTGVAVEPDALYAIDFAYRVNAGTLAAWPGLGNSNESVLGRTYGYIADGLWHRAQLVVPVPADNVADLRAVFRINNGDADLADVRVTRLDPGLLPGGDFEFADLRGWRRYGPSGCTHSAASVFNGGGSLRCDVGQKQQIVGLALPGGRYLLTGAAMIESGSAAIRVGDRDSNVDIDRALGLYQRAGFQTFARVIDLPHGSPDLRVVISSAGRAHFDALRLRPLRATTALLGGGIETNADAWINRNAGRCRVAYTDQIEGDVALSCAGEVEARQSRVPVRASRLYRLDAALDCIEGTCRGDVVLNGGAQLSGPVIGPTAGPIPYARLFRVPDGIESVDVRFRIEGRGMLDAVRLTPVPSGGSILTNGSFEAPFELGWRRYGRAGCSVVETDAWDGTAALRCVDQAAQQIRIPALPATRYRLSWRRRGAGSLEVRIGDRNSNTDAFGDPWFGGPAGDGWIIEDRVFDWPDAGSDDLRVVLASSGPVDIDDLRLVPVTDDNLLRAGDFDSGSVVGWSAYGASACVATGDAAFSGAGGALCDGGGLQQLDLPLSAGRTYRLTYAWRVDSGLLQVRIGAGTSNIDFEGGGLSSGPTAAWAEQTRLFTLPADFAGDARLVISSSGIARLDAFHLEAVD